MLTKYKNLHKRYKDTIELLGTIRSHTNSEYIAEHSGPSGLMVIEAQKLQAAVYLGRNFIAPEDIGNDGRMHIRADPHQEHASYFTIRNKKTNKVIGTARQIFHHESKGHHSYPLMAKADINTAWRKFIVNHNPEDIIEISGLAKVRDATSMAPLYLFRAMWHQSLVQRHKLWLMACDVRLFERLKLLLGDAIIKIGEETSYQGGNVIPAIVKPNEGLCALIDSTKKARLLKRKLRYLAIEFFVQGLPTHLVTLSDKKSLKSIGISLSKSTHMRNK